MRGGWYPERGGSVREFCVLVYAVHAPAGKGHLHSELCVAARLVEERTQAKVVERCGRTREAALRTREQELGGAPLQVMQVGAHSGHGAQRAGGRALGVGQRATTSDFQVGAIQSKTRLRLRTASGTRTLHASWPHRAHRRATTLPELRPAGALQRPQSRARSTRSLPVSPAARSPIAPCACTPAMHA